MDSDLNKQRVNEAVAAFNAGDLDGYLAIYADDAVVHGLPTEYGNTVDGHRRLLESMRHAMEDFTIEQLSLVAEGDMVAAHVKYTGIHDGIFHGVRPTGKRLTWHSMVFRRFDDEGRTAERWMVSDSMNLMRQLGAH